MTPEDVKKFEKLQDLFSHPGWALLIDECNFKVDAIKESFTTFGLTEALVAYGQGRVSVYRELNSLPLIIEQALKPEDVETDPI